MVNYLVTRLLPPRPLPKMDFEDSGIPDAFRTLVVVPMMLVNAETIRAEVEKLEIRYLANKEANLLFSLFTDYTDSATLTREDDSRLLQTASECLEALNQRHGGERFFLFHRERTWSESEQKFIGWERKRGKLEELNRLIDGTRPETAARHGLRGRPGSAGGRPLHHHPGQRHPVAARYGPQDGRDPGAPPQSAALRCGGQHHGRLLHHHPAAGEPDPAEHERLDLQPALRRCSRHRPLHPGGLRCLSGLER